MGWFKKKDKIIDLTEYYNDRQRETSQTKEVLDLTQSSNNSSNTNTASSGSGSFFGGIFGDANKTSTYGSGESSLDPDAKRKRFAKRLKDMTDKMEDISNQIYHLQQRIEVIERKMDVSRF